VSGDAGGEEAALTLIEAEEHVHDDAKIMHQPLVMVRTAVHTEAPACACRVADGAAGYAICASVPNRPTHLHTFPYTLTLSFTHARTHTHTHSRSHTRAHTHTHIHTHIVTHMRGHCTEPPTSCRSFRGRP